MRRVLKQQLLKIVEIGFRYFIRSGDFAGLTFFDKFYEGFDLFLGEICQKFGKTDNHREKPVESCENCMRLSGHEQIANIRVYVVSRETGNEYRPKKEYLQCRLRFWLLTTQHLTDL